MSAVVTLDCDWFPPYVPIWADTGWASKKAASVRVPGFTIFIKFICPAPS